MSIIEVIEHHLKVLIPKTVTEDWPNIRGRKNLMGKKDQKLYKARLLFSHSQLVLKLVLCCDLCTEVNEVK